MPCVSSCNCNKPCAATVWNVGVFSFLPWVDWCCMVIRKLQVIDIQCAATVWTFVCFLFQSWVNGYCMVIRKLQVIEIPCAATVCLCSVIKSICFLFCRENWWKLMPCLLMLFIAVNMIVSAIVCKWVLNIVSATVCMGASVWNICVCAPINVVWAAGFVTDYWNTCCSLWCVAIGVHIYKLCLFCEVSIESPVTVLGIQYLLLFRWFLYMLVCTIMVIRKEKKMGQGILNNRMRTKGEKIHVRIY